MHGFAVPTLLWEQGVWEMETGEFLEFRIVSLV